LEHPHIDLCVTGTTVGSYHGLQGMETARRADRGAKGLHNGAKPEKQET
jgi:hypothetical protein